MKKTYMMPSIYMIQVRTEAPLATSNTGDTLNQNYDNQNITTTNDEVDGFGSNRGLLWDDED